MGCRKIQLQFKLIWRYWWSHHCVKSVYIRTFSVPFYPAFGLKILTLLKSHFDMGVLLQVCCTFSEHFFLITPLEGCFCILVMEAYSYLVVFIYNLRYYIKISINSKIFQIYNVLRMQNMQIFFPYCLFLYWKFSLAVFNNLHIYLYHLGLDQSRNMVLSLFKRRKSSEWFFIVKAYDLSESLWSNCIKFHWFAMCGGLFMTI